jgi:hypothetical protein
MIHLQMADQPEPGPSSRRRPTDNPGRVPDLATSEQPMETEESGATATEKETNNQKKMKRSNAELVIESEKSKVKFIDTQCNFKYIIFTNGICLTI